MKAESKEVGARHNTPPIRSCLYVYTNKGLDKKVFVVRDEALHFSEALGFSLPSLLANPALHPPHQPFSKTFLMNTVFSIMLNLFDNNKPYALSTHNRKCANKMHHIW